MISASFPSLLQSFLTDRLLLQFAKEKLGKMPSQLKIEDLDAPFIVLFLEHLERPRKNKPLVMTSRNHTIAHLASR